MVFQIIPIRPNPRGKYQKQVENLCKLLRDGVGTYYRASVFSLLTLRGANFIRSGRHRFSELHRARLFLRDHPADERAINIVNELDKIYASNPAEIDNLRGAVGEVFAYFICRKIYPKADIEVQVRIGDWTSRSIDTAGCSHKKGHCLQSKFTLQDLNSIIQQKLDFDEIEKLTKNKAQGAFVTYVDRRAFYLLLRSNGINPSEYRVFDRVDLNRLETCLKDFSPVS